MRNHNPIYDQALKQFITGVRSEEDYVSIHTKPHEWPEAVEARQNHVLFSKYLEIFTKPMFRRQALCGSMRITQDKLKQYLQIGSSTASRLITKSEGRLGKENIADFALYVRVPFELANSSTYPGKFTTTAFDLQSQEAKVFSSVRQILNCERGSRAFEGVILKREGAPVIHLRVEWKKENIIIIDIIDPFTWSVDLVASELALLPGQWFYIELPSVILNHSFVIFISGESRKAIDEFIAAEFNLQIKANALSTIYGGKLLRK